MKSRSVIVSALVAGSALVAAFGASAQGASDLSRARLAWAERHAATVCQPLADRGQARKAARCLDRVAAVRADARQGLEATASVAAAPAARSAGRCVGIQCIERTSFLGMSY